THDPAPNRDFSATSALTGDNLLPLSPHQQPLYPLGLYPPELPWSSLHTRGNNGAMNNRDLTFLIEPSRLAVRGIGMCAPVVLCMRAPVHVARLDLEAYGREEIGILKSTNELTAAMRNLTTLEITEIQCDHFLLSMKYMDGDLVLFFAGFPIIPADIAPGYYALDFSIWNCEPDKYPTGAASSRMFEVIVKDDAPLDEFTEKELQVIAMLKLENRLDLSHLGMEKSSGTGRIDGYGPMVVADNWPF
ncbi:hypothetical protein QBC39DRAFT_92289, partial [Podospora conica]